MGRLLHLLLIIGALAALLPKAWAGLPESEVRAAIIVNFVHYVEWPDNPAANAEMLICVAGHGATAEALLAYNGKTVHGRRVAVENRPFSAYWSGCRVLFIGETSTRDPMEWLRDAAGLPILTVSEGEDFLANGGIIALNRIANRISFDVNLAAVRRSSLRIGSQLLRLARDVHGK